MHRSNRSSTSHLQALLLFRVHFLWFVQATPLYHRLGPNISREICLYYQFGSPKIVKIEDGKVKYLYAELRSWRTMYPVKKNLFEREYSAVLWISDEYVFKCGGYEKPMVETRAAYLLSRDFVTELNEMSVPRTFHGIAFALHTSSIFVFGGHHGSSTSHIDTLISAEKFSILTEQWTPLPDMLDARYCFQPCISGRTIVLCGGNKAGSCELFDIDRREYRRLEFVTKPGAALTVTDGETIVTHSHGLTQKWSLSSLDLSNASAVLPSSSPKSPDQHTGRLEVHSAHLPQDVKWSPCPALRIAHKTYFYSYDSGNCERILDEQSSS